jgi:diguanylate cyclase (GGDEF)-like protein/PAS domain S-box-containing protein
VKPANSTTTVHPPRALSLLDPPRRCDQVAAPPRRRRRAGTTPNDTGLTSWLSEHPGSNFAALDHRGAIVPMPASIRLPAESLVDERSTLELVVSEDFRTVTDAFVDALRDGTGSALIHLASDPSTTLDLQYLDLRAEHGVILRLVTASDRGDDPVRSWRELRSAPPRPRLGVMTKDEQAIITSIDIATNLMLGWHRDEMVGRSNLEFVHPDDHLKAIGNWMALLDEKPGPLARTVRLRYRCKDGSWLWLETSNELQTDPDGTSIVVAQLIDVSDEMEALEALRDSGDRFRMLVKHSSDVIAVVNDKLDLLYANPAGERMLGYTLDNELGRNMLDFVHPVDRESTATAFGWTLSKPGAHLPSVFRFRDAAGAWHVLEVVASNCLDDPAVGGIVLNARDVTESANVARAQRTLSAGIHVVVRAADEMSLVADICQMMVDVGGYQMAWVGYVEQDARCTIRPVASVGAPHDDPHVRLSWADDEFGQGPAGCAVRAKAAHVVNDIHESRHFAPWRPVAEQHGLRSCCAVPLEIAGAVIGVLGVYASDPGRFDAAELALMSELASELSFGIGRLRDASSLQASEERFRVLAGASPIGVLEVSAAGLVEYANPRAAEIAGTDLASIMDGGWLDAVHPDDLATLRESIEDARPVGGDIVTRFRVRHPDGEVRHIRVSAAAKPAEIGSGYVVAVEDVTEEVNAQTELAHQAFYDTLTGLPNRALFLDRLNQELARHRRGGPHIAVLFLDLDRFKIVNDSLGHEAGDVVLKEIGNRFKNSVRAGETAARFGGDEFMFILREVHDVSDAGAVARRLLSLFDSPIRCGDQDLTVTASIGIVIPGVHADATTVLRDADTAMYQAKSTGRNCFAMFDEKLHKRSADRLAIETELRQALARHQFELYYQPAVDPATGQPRSAEALIRWNHPTRGLVSPLEFIPVAEETGLIGAIGSWVLEEAVSQLAAWDADDDGPRLARLGVNFSARQLDDPGTLDTVRAVLDRYAIAPRRVAVEVTESVLMADGATTLRSLEGFRELGLQVAIDDFGTGYSSLAYLHVLPVTTVKIDRSFIERLDGPDDSTAVVRAIVEMCHAMGLRVVAEGVSDEHLARVVALLGCDAAQGFYWAKPMPAEKFSCWWRKAAR